VNTYPGKTMTISWDYDAAANPMTDGFYLYILKPDGGVAQKQLIQDRNARSLTFQWGVGTPGEYYMGIQAVCQADPVVTASEVVRSEMIIATPVPAPPQVVLAPPTNVRVV
jgi:hypothetical protein